MAIINVPPATDTQVLASGNTGAVAFSVQTGFVTLAPGDVATLGGLVRLGPSDVLWLAANTPEAASEWRALSAIGASVVVWVF